MRVQPDYTYRRRHKYVGGCQHMCGTVLLLSHPTATPHVHPSTDARRLIFRGDLSDVLGRGLVDARTEKQLDKVLHKFRFTARPHCSQCGALY